MTGHTEAKPLGGLGVVGGGCADQTTTTAERAEHAEMVVNWSNLLFAPDGRRLAMQIATPGPSDIFVYEWARDALTPLTSDPAFDSKPVWTPDSRRIAFGSARGDPSTLNLYWQRADGTGDAQRLTESKK